MLHARLDSSSSKELFGNVAMQEEQTQLLNKLQVKRKRIAANDRDADWMRQHDEYAESQLGQQPQQDPKWQHDSMETLMKKARDELKNQNNMGRGKSTSKGAQQSALSFMSPFNYQRSMLQERKCGDTLPREQIKNHSFNINQQAARPKTSFIDSYYNLSNSKASQ